MSANLDSKKTVILGAGPVGSLLSLFLAQKKIKTKIYERRSDMRIQTVDRGRSINLAVSTRGIEALKQVGLETEILKQAVSMPGRMIHTLSGETTFQPYGKSLDQCIYSISRAGLNQTLMSAAEKTGLVEIFFNERVTGADFKKNLITLQNEKTKLQHSLTADHFFVTDGSGSIIRKTMVDQLQAQCTESLLDYGYKELVIPPHLSKLHLNALHIWPRGHFMLIALPNFDQSFTCTLFLPFKGKDSFETLQSSDQVLDFFKTYFSDAIALIPNLVSEFFENPTGQMVTVKTSPWNVGGQFLLLGDAAHAIVPFFGQGMNCGFEDCTLFSKKMDQNWDLVFSDFSLSRKTDSDAIADMAVENFTEMRDRVGDPKFLLKKEVEKILLNQFPHFVSRYSLVTFSQIPYHLALRAGLVADQILSELCESLDQPKNVDLLKAKHLIEKKFNRKDFPWILN